MDTFIRSDQLRTRLSWRAHRGEATAGVADPRYVLADGGRAKSVVCLAGTGAVGGLAAESFGRLGHPVIGVDPDKFEADSWRTQWCDAADAGRSKADCLGERLSRINPGPTHLTARGWIQDVPWQVLSGADVLVSTGDNLQMLLYLGRMAAALRKPLVQGAVHRETWSAIVRVWDNRGGEAACPACQVSAAEWSRLQVRQGCAERALYAAGETATRTWPFVCSIAGNMVVAATTSLLEAPLTEPAQEVLYCTQTHQLYRTPLSRHPECRCPHRPWEVVALDRGVDAITLEMALTLAGQGGAGTGVEVSSELPWCSWTYCDECHRHRVVQRFAEAGDAVGTCICGALLKALPMGLRRVIPRGDLEQRAGEVLREVGLPSGRAIVVDDGEAPPWCGFVGRMHELPPGPDGASLAAGLARSVPVIQS